MNTHAQKISSEIHNFSYSLLTVRGPHAVSYVLTSTDPAVKAPIVLRNAWIISMNLHYSSHDQVPV